MRRRQGNSAGSADLKGQALTQMYFVRARALARSGEVNMAARLCQDAVALDPTLADAMEFEAELLDLQGHSGAAFEKYKTARNVRRSLRAGTPDRHFVWRQAGQSVANVLAYDNVLKSLKKYSLPYLARGNAYLSIGQPQQALADYQRALKVKPGLLDAVALKGEALSAAGRYEEAVTAFNEVLASRPSDADTLNSRGIAYMALGRVADANRDWKAQFDLMTGRPSARACLALRMGEYGLAVGELEQVLERRPVDAYWSLYLAAAKRRLGAPPREAHTDGEGWPDLLLRLYDGSVTEREVVEAAGNEARRVEAWFHLGVIAHGENPAAATSMWRRVVDHGAPFMIEYAAARNELSRLGG